MTIRVLLADDQAMVRAGFRLILDHEDDIEVVGEAEDGARTVDETRRLRPDIVLMDIQMPVLDGLEATRRLADEVASRIVILTTFERDDYIIEALRSGASGFLLKNAPPEDLLQALRVVARGDALLAPSVTRRLIERFAEQGVVAPRGDGVADLTDRETEVLRLVARGLSNSEIAAALVVSEATVKTHVSRVLTKLQLRDRVQAVVHAYESGMVRPGAG